MMLDTGRLGADLNPRPWRERFQGGEGAGAVLTPAPRLKVDAVVDECLRPSSRPCQLRTVYTQRSESGSIELEEQ